MKLVAIIRPIETSEIEVECNDYAAGKAELERLTPPGYAMLSVRKAD